MRLEPTSWLSSLARVGKSPLPTPREFLCRISIKSALSMPDIVTRGLRDHRSNILCPNTTLVIALISAPGPRKLGDISLDLFKARLSRNSHNPQRERKILVGFCYAFLIVGTPSAIVLGNLFQERKREYRICDWAITRDLSGRKWCLLSVPRVVITNVFWRILCNIEYYRIIPRNISLYLHPTTVRI